MADEAFLQRLRAIFAEEAREHLAQVDAGLVALEQGAQPPGTHAVEQVLKPLHTLKGAARALDEGELERLCHELEGVLAVARARGAVLAADQFDRLHQGAAAARALAQAPGARNRNRALASTAQLAALSQELAKAGPGNPPTGHPVAAPEAQPAIADTGVSGAGSEAVHGASHDRIRVQGKSIDAIRAHAEALLPVELQLRHQLEALRELALAMGVQRHEAGTAAAAGAADSARFELACTQIASRLARTGDELHATRTRLIEATLETALVPFEAAVDELPALVRNLARSHGKRIELVLRGGGVAIDRRLLAVVREALIHLVTNAADHGIEAPAQRRAVGKPDSGQIAVTVVQRDARQVAVRISDDGAGIDSGALVQAAVLRCGLDPAALANMGEQQRLQLALRAGVSTRDEVTPVSG
jgi:two-component system chemotaxis sensor kinase CheA